MTTSTFNAAEVPALREKTPLAQSIKPATTGQSKRRHTLASRLLFLTICVAVVLTTLAYGTVHYWAMAAFALSAAGIVCLWCVDGLVLRSVQLSRNALQWSLLGLIGLGLVQLLPLRFPDNAGLPLSPARSLSLDPHSTVLFLVQMSALFVYFAATLIFTDTPHRLRIIVRTITIFGFLLAMFGLTQSFTSDGTRVYWFRQLTQSTAFGPFINRHHFAGYMELAIALPLGLLFSGSIESYKRPLYAFAAMMMGVALIMTNSRGGIISLAAEILFLAVVAGPGLRQGERRPRAERIRSALLRAGLAFGLIVVLIGAAIAVGGSDVFTRFLGTANADDPTTGRAHFWSVTLDVIKTYPIVGSGLGSFSVIYPLYDSRNGFYRLEQAHNDYLQTLSDGGIVGGLLGLGFLVVLFGKGFARRETDDKFRRGVATGALAGCFAVLVHSFFDFTLHTTSNALLFLILAALATQDSRVDQGGHHHRGARRRRRLRGEGIEAAGSRMPDAGHAEPKARTLTPAPLGDDQFLQNFFYWAFLRYPNSTELAYWDDILRTAYPQGQTAMLIAMRELGMTVFESAEYAGRNRSNHDYVYDLYKTFLMRDPDSGGWANWENSVPTMGRENVRHGFEYSVEFSNLVATVTPNGAASGNAASLDTARIDPNNQTGNQLLARDCEWGVGLLNLLGRAGLDLGLGLSYSSLVWTRSGPYLYFDADNGLPSPGFRLGFATIQGAHFDAQAGHNVYMLIGSSGHRVELRQVGTSNVYEAGDSSYLQLTDNGGNLLVKTTDGTQITYLWFENEWRATKLKIGKSGSGLRFWSDRAIP